MNNPNPFVPKGSLLEQQNKRRAHMKIGVFCVLAVSVAGLMAMLIQGCKQKPNPDETPSSDTNPVPAVTDTNNPPTDLSNTNPPPASPGSNTAVMVPAPNAPAGPGAQPAPSPIAMPTPIVQPQTPVTPVTTPDLSGGAEYVIVKGDTLGKIAHKNGVTLKALLAANPDAKPTRLKVGEKLVIPAGGKSLTDTAAGADTGAVADTGGVTYTVKSNDTLTKIAKTHHVKLKALMAANNLTSTKIKVGQKLKIPSKGEVPPAPVEASAPTPTVDNSNTMPAPPVPQVSTAPAAPAPPVQH